MNFLKQLLILLILALAPLAHGQTFELLHSFDGIEGAEPWAGVMQGSDGMFYGITKLGGASNRGTVFRITADPFAKIREIRGKKNSRFATFASVVRV